MIENARRLRRTFTAAFWYIGVSTRFTLSVTDTGGPFQSAVTTVTRHRSFVAPQHSPLPLVAASRKVDVLMPARTNTSVVVRRKPHSVVAPPSETIRLPNDHASEPIAAALSDLRPATDYGQNFAGNNKTIADYCCQLQLPSNRTLTIEPLRTTVGQLHFGHFFFKV